ncbi:MAG: hypothetical protein U5J96_04780, partial [Ignavibacteriaceae bacterium]|nr:hypothetical protein [Ignavibacteriaceae bacterium]
QQYDQFLKESKVLTNTAEVSMVTDGMKLEPRAVEKYMAANKLSDRLKGYNWEFNLVEDEQVNAWCMPEMEKFLLFIPRNTSCDTG